MQYAANVSAARGRRPAFTLIELLIVIAIIGVLAGLAISGAMALRASQMKRFTEVTVEKLASALDQQWKATLDDIKQEEPNLTPSSGVAQVSGGDLRRSRVIYAKMRLKARFPISFAQAVKPDPAPGAAGPLVLPESLFVRELTGVNATNVPLDVQSSILLFISLSQARRGMAAFSPSELDPTAITTYEIPLTGGGTKTMTHFKDAWEHPIRFFNFPTANDELNDNPYVNINEAANLRKGRDPMDPEGTLYVPTAQWPTSLRNQFIARVHTLAATGTNPTARNLIPVVCSAGPDGAWGLNETTLDMAITAADQAGDNIVSYRLRRAGARGD